MTFVGAQSINTRDISKLKIYYALFFVGGGGGARATPLPFNSSISFHSRSHT